MLRAQASCSAGVRGSRRTASGRDAALGGQRLEGLAVIDRHRRAAADAQQRVAGQREMRERGGQEQALRAASSPSAPAPMTGPIIVPKP